MSRWHPSAEEIDDAIDADLSATTRGRVIARHLGQCDQCVATRSSLLDTRAQLRALSQTPPPLPPGWDETVAAALRRAREDAVDQPRPTGRRRWYALAASAALLLGIGGVLAPRLISGGTSDRSASDVASTPQASAEVGVADADANTVPPQERRLAAAAGGQPAVSISSGTDYRPVTVRQQTRDQLAAAPVAGASSDLGADRADAALAERCTELMRLGIGARPRNATVRLVDQAQWQGDPAVIVVTDAASGNGMDVWVMPAECEGEGPVAKVADVTVD